MPATLSRALEKSSAGREAKTGASGRVTRSRVRQICLRLMLAGLGLGLLSRGLGQTTVPAPAQVLDLTQWKLTLPTGNPGSPTEILQLALGASAATNY